MMNRDQVEGTGKQLNGKIKQAWGRLTDDEIALFEGKSEEFYGKVQQKYGLAREDAERRIQEMQKAPNDANRAA